ncbi:MAG: DsbA family protein [Chitinophagales bacterium]
MAQNKPTLIYIGDPLCSWCYGFAEEISKAKESLKEKVDFELIMGGLRPYNTETMKSLGDFLKEHWEHVQERSGQPFNYDILNDHSFVYDTEPPSRAVKTMESIQPDKAFEFFKAIQKTFYADNLNTNHVDTYLPIVASYGIDGEKFKVAFESEEMKQATRDDFEKSANMGVSGFPTVVLQMGDKLILISNGYTTATSIELQVQKYMAKEKNN